MIMEEALKKLIETSFQTWQRKKKRCNKNPVFQICNMV